MIAGLLPLASPRLSLRALNEDDLEVLWALHSNVEAMRYWSSPALKQREQAADLLAKLLASAAANESLTIIVEYQGLAIGRVALFNYSAQCERVEIGYILSPQYWGKGFMKEALAVLFDRLFSHHGLYRIEADIDPDNRASAALLDSLKFSQEGKLKGRWLIAGKRLDSLIYGLLKPEWNVHDASTAN